MYPKQQTPLQCLKIDEPLVLPLVEIFMFSEGFHTALTQKNTTDGNCDQASCDQANNNEARFKRS
jgi:hypothetical protein